MTTPPANIIFNSERLKAFSLKMKNKIRVPTLTTPIQHSTGSPSQSNEKRKEEIMNYHKEKFKKQSPVQLHQKQ